MQHAEQFLFTVESYNTDPDGRAQQTDCQQVMAATAEAAAAKVLQEELFLIGNVQRLRAMAWRVGADGRRIEARLYSQG